MTRTRTNTEPKNGGKVCPTGAQERDCNTHHCPIDCEVNAWSDWGLCSGTCIDTLVNGFGTNTQDRVRTIKTNVKYGGKACPTPTESQVCGDIGCPIPCEGKWSTWSTCTKSCENKQRSGTGYKIADSETSPTQTRQHVEVSAAQYGGEKCKDDETRTCNTHGCPIDCAMETWTSWSACSHSCGDREDGSKATQTRTRGIVEPAFGGKACLTSKDARICTTTNSPYWTAACPTPSPTKVPTAQPTNVPYPIINVIGGDLITVEATTDLQQSYDDEGATCYDTHDEDLTQNVVVMGDIVNLIDAYSACRHIQYECTNTAGLTSSKIRTVCVEDTTCPTCTMNNPTVQTVTVEASFPYVDGGASCSDSFDGAKTMVEKYSYGGAATDSVNVEQTGTYVITYTATDDSNNDCDAKNPRRTVVVMDTLKPVIGLQYGNKFLHTTMSNGQTIDQSSGATIGNGQGQDTNPATNEMQPNPIAAGGKVHSTFQNYFSLMAETSTGSSAFVLGAIASAISGIALVSYAAQQRSTSAVADLV